MLPHGDGCTPSRPACLRPPCLPFGPMNSRLRPIIAGFHMIFKYCAMDSSLTCGITTDWSFPAMPTIVVGPNCTRVHASDDAVLTFSKPFLFIAGLLHLQKSLQLRMAASLPVMRLGWASTTLLTVLTFRRQEYPLSPLPLFSTASAQCPRLALPNFLYYVLQGVV